MVASCHVKDALSVMTMLFLGDQKETKTDRQYIRHEWVNGDQVHLMQIFSNLLSNAVKYTQEGGKIQFLVEECETNSSVYAKYRFLGILQGIRFLCAEDNGLNAEILTELLKIEGAECTICENGERVLETFEKSAPGDYDMILMDVQMPVMNGYEATKAIRRSSHELAKTIPIIAMTANSFAEDVQASLDAGMNAHLSKPIVMDEVIKTILRYVHFDKEY